MRAEVSYVWGYHEFGFWGAFNAGKGLGIVDPTTQEPFENNTVHTYNAFYRVQFGDANEWKVWGGATHEGQGYVGSLLRAPMTRSLALEGTFAYLMPGSAQTKVLLNPTAGSPITTTFLQWLGIWVSILFIIHEVDRDEALQVHTDRSSTLLTTEQ